jgi:chromosome segregation and condensation protein ScpB
MLNDGNGVRHPCYDTQAKDRFTDEGRGEHLVEIGEGMKFFFEPENQKIVKEEIEKYKNIQFNSITV